jgi:hypothetical protein
MGKSTLVTRRGCDSTLSRPSAAVVKNILVARRQCETTTLWAGRMSAGKSILVGEFAPAVNATQPCVCPFGRVTRCGYLVILC